MKMRCYCGDEAARACIKYDTSDYWCIVKYFVGKKVKNVKFSFVPLFIQRLFWRTKDKVYGNAKLVAQSSLLVIDALRALMRINDSPAVHLYASKHCIRLLLQIDDGNIAVFKLSHGGYLISTKIWMHTSIEQVVHNFRGYYYTELNDEQSKHYKEMAKAISSNIIDCFSLSTEDLTSEGLVYGETAE